MEEKTIIKGEQGNITTTRNLILLIGVIISIVITTLTGLAGTSPTIIDYLLVGFVLFIPFLVIGIVFYACTSKISIVVTNKRVYGNAAFGKRVDLPLDMINAVGTSMFNGIAVTTASGAIKFLMIKNKDEIHNEISKLLINRQDKPIATATIKQEIPQSNAEELKKYKELLDSGVISQSEFDAKKKQLLGL